VAAEVAAGRDRADAGEREQLAARARAAGARRERAGEEDRPRRVQGGVGDPDAANAVAGGLGVGPVGEAGDEPLGEAAVFVTQIPGFGTGFSPE
jgi:hypothetical protein